VCAVLILSTFGQFTTQLLCCSCVDVPSPKLIEYDPIGKDMDWAMNKTVSGAVPDCGEAEKLIMVGTTSPPTLTVLVVFVSPPALSLTLTVMV
jgi:hypothetical protein